MVKLPATFLIFRRLSSLINNTRPIQKAQEKFNIGVETGEMMGNMPQIPFLIAWKKEQLKRQPTLNRSSELGQMDEHGSVSLNTKDFYFGEVL